MSSALLISGVGLMAWSPIAMGLVSGKLDDSGLPIISRSALKVNFFCSSRLQATIVIQTENSEDSITLFKIIHNGCTDVALAPELALLFGVIELDIVVTENK